MSNYKNIKMAEKTEDDKALQNIIETILKPMSGAVVITGEGIGVLQENGEVRIITAEKADE